MCLALPRVLLVIVGLLLIQGCFHTQLSGSVGGAEVTVTELDNANKVVASATTTSEASLKQKPGLEAWNAWKPFARLALMGVFVLEPGVDPDKLYLVTASGGDDEDVDLDLEPDEVATAVAGEWRAIMTGAQLLTRDRKVSVLTEAVYQSLETDLGGLSDTQILARLDKAAARVIGDENGDGTVDYLDVLQWSRLKDRGELRADLVDLDRLSLAIREDQEETALKSLGNRVLDGQSAVDAEDLGATKVLGDDSCEGRARAVVSVPGESITTVPPSAACDDNDTGYVESTQDNNTAVISPTSNGYTRLVEMQGASLAFSDYNLDEGTVKVTREEPGKESKSLKQDIPSREQLQNVSNTYRRITSLAGASGNAGPSASRLRQVYGRGAEAGEISASATFTTTANDSAEAFADILSYGTLASSWSACMAYRFFAGELASGESVPEAALQWAIKGCTSLLAEVQVWIEEASDKELEAFEKTAPEIETAGCSECYSYVVSPEPALVTVADSPVAFEGVAPQSSRSVEWAFGDGSVDTGRSALHSYRAPGEYTAQFRVEYVDGSSASNSVRVSVEKPSDQCIRAPEVNAGSDQVVDASSAVVLSGRGETFVEPGCSVAAGGFQWEQVGSGPTVALAGDGDATATFTAPEVNEETELSFRLTVEDTDGGLGADTMSVTVRPRNACSRGPEVSANYQYIPEVDVYALDFSAEAFGAACDIVGSEWQQQAGNSDPIVTLLYETIYGTAFLADGLGIQSTTELNFRVTVRDTDGNAASDTVTVPVEPPPPLDCSLPPTVNPTATVSAVDNLIALLPGERVYGPNCTIDSLQWRQVGGAPQVDLIEVQSGETGFYIPSVTEATTLRFEVEVFDSDGQAASDTVNYIVEPQELACNANTGVSTYYEDAYVNYGREDPNSVYIGYTHEQDEGDCALASASWEQEQGPLVNVFQHEGSEYEFARPFLEQDTLFVFKLTVTDSGGNVGTSNLSFTLRKNVTGYTVSRITALDANGILVGYWQQTGADTWVELDSDNVTVRFGFVEYGRDGNSVYMHSTDRPGVDIQLDLFARQVRYREEPDPYGFLYILADPQ